MIIKYSIQLCMSWNTQILSVNSSPKWCCKEDPESLLITTEWNNVNEKYTWPKGLPKDKIKRKELLN